MMPNILLDPLASTTLNAASTPVTIEHLWTPTGQLPLDVDAKTIASNSPGVQWQGDAFAPMSRALHPRISAQGGMLLGASVLNRAWNQADGMPLRFSNGTIEVCPTGTTNGTKRAVTLLGLPGLAYQDLGTGKGPQLAYWPDAVSAGDTFVFDFLFRFAITPVPNNPPYHFHVILREGNPTGSNLTNSPTHNAHNYRLILSNGTFEHANVANPLRLNVENIQVHSFNSETYWIKISIATYTDLPAGLSVWAAFPGGLTGNQRYEVVPLYFGLPPGMEDYDGWVAAPGLVTSAGLSFTHSVRLPRTIAVVAKKPTPVANMTIIEVNGGGSTARLRLLDTGAIELSSNGHIRTVTDEDIWSQTLAEPIGIRITSNGASAEVHGQVIAHIQDTWKSIETFTLGSRADGSEPFGEELVCAALSLDPGWQPATRFVRLDGVDEIHAISPVRGWLYGWSA